MASPPLSDAWFPPHVGGTFDGGILELGKQGIVLSDAVVADLHIPIMQEALELQDDVFRIADELGVGAEVRAAVYTIRGAEYASTLASGMVPAGATAAGASVLAGIGGVAALGAIAVVGAIVFGLFSSGDDQADKRVKRAQAAALHLRDRLTLAQFAAEQDDARVSEQGLEALAKVWPSFGTPAEHAAAADRAGKLAAFYRRADLELAPHQRALFESLSNLARWQAALDAYAKLSWPKKDAIDVLFGKSAPRLPTQLAGPMKGELAEAERLTHAVATEHAVATGLVGLVLLGAGAAALAYFAPAKAAALLRGLVSAPNLVYTKAKGLLR